jgi:hypothetical protein
LGFRRLEIPFDGFEWLEVDERLGAGAASGGAATGAFHNAGVRAKKMRG